MNVMNISQYLQNYSNPNKEPMAFVISDVKQQNISNNEAEKIFM